MNFNLHKFLEIILSIVLTIIFALGFYFLGFFLKDIKMVEYVLTFIFIFAVLIIILQVFKYEKFKKKM